MKYTVLLILVLIHGIPADVVNLLPDSLCSDGWKQVKDLSRGGQVCIKLFTDPRSWDQAQEICNNEFGHLLTLNKNFYHKAGIENVQDVVQKEIDDIFHNSGVNTVWTSLRISGGKLWWMEILPQPVQSEPALLWRWAVDQPSPSTGQCGHLSLQHNAMSRSFQLEMSLQNCDHQLPFICINSGFIIKPVQVPHCPSDWLGTFYSDKCYKYLQTTDKLSYSDAQLGCVQQGGHLASPSSAVSFGLVRATVQVQSGVHCIEYSGIENEEDVHSLTAIKICNPGQVCQTTVELSLDKITYSKNCEDSDICTSHVDISRSLCHSGDVVFQAGFTELQCFDCCNSSDCTVSVKTRGGPLAQTVTNFERGLSPSRSKRQSDHLIKQDASSPKYWIGLKKDRTGFSWESGEVYDANRSHFGPLYESQQTEGCVRVNGEYWEIIPCQQLLSYVCQQTVRLNPVEITKISGNKTLLSKSIQWRQSTASSAACNGNNHSPQLCCELQGDYPPYIPVLWVKDGIYISNGLPPGGFKLDLTKDLQFRLDVSHQGSIAYLQGFYHCEVWSMFPLKKASSQAVKVTFKDIMTYRGSIHTGEAIQNMSSIQSELLQWGVVLNELTEYQWLIETLMKITLLSRLLVPSVEITGLSDGGKVLEFTVHYQLTDFDGKDWLNIKDVLNIKLFNPYSKYHGDQEKEKMSWFISELDERFLNYIKEKLVQKIKDENSVWSQFYGHLKLTERDVTITSTVACPSITISQNGEMFSFMRSPMGNTAMSDEVCLSDGKALASLTCAGNYYSGGLWRGLQIYDHCLQPKFSQRTQQLKDLSQKEVNAETAGEMSREMADLTEKHQGLNHADVVFASKVVRNVASNPGNVLQIGENILQTVNNLMSVSADVLKNAQQVDKAATRLLSLLIPDAVVPKIKFQVPPLTVKFTNLTNGGHSDDSQNLIGFKLDQGPSSDFYHEVPTSSICVTMPTDKQRLLESLDTYTVTASLEKNLFQRIVKPKLALEIWQYENTSDSLHGFGVKRSGSTDVIQNDSVLTVADNGDREFMASDDAPDLNVAIIFPTEVMNKVQMKIVSARSPSLDPDDPFYYLMNEQSVRLKFMVYQDAGLFLSPSQLAGAPMQVVSGGQVVAGSVLGVAVQNLSQPVTSIFSPTKPANISDYQCAFWDITAVGGKGNWSTEGCWLNGSQDDKIICHCNHLTNFAIITQVERGDIPDSHHFALSVISLIGAILSILGLTLTLLSFILFRKLRKGISQKTLVNLAAALLCTNVVFLCGIDRTEYYRGCAAIAAILQYFLLASFSWMLVEGVLHYLKFVKVLDAYVHRFMLKAASFAWGGPAAVVILVTCVDWRLFRGHDDYCWLSQSAFYYSFLLPVCCILLINSVLFVLVVKGITCDRPKGLKSTQSNNELVALQVKAAVSCFILLGLTWIFGFLAVHNARLVFQYIFCILNAFHGFWIFLNYCIREPSVRHHWREFICCKYSIVKRKYSHTVSSGVFSSSGSGNNKNNAEHNLVCRERIAEQDTGKSNTPTIRTQTEDTGTVSTAFSSRLSSMDEGNLSEDIVCRKRLNEPVYENWNNVFQEQRSVTINMNTGIPYRSSLPRNKNGFGMEGLYNAAYQNMEFNSSEV